MFRIWKRLAVPIFALAIPAVWWWIGRLTEQLASGAAPWSLENLAVFAGTLVLGMACSVWSSCSGKSRGNTSGSSSEPAEPILHALDVLFRHFPGDAAARGAVRKVAHAVTDQRYADSPAEQSAQNTAERSAHHAAERTADRSAETEVLHG